MAKFESEIDEFEKKVRENVDKLNEKFKWVKYLLIELLLKIQKEVISEVYSHYTDLVPRLKETVIK